MQRQGVQEAWHTLRNRVPSRQWVVVDPQDAIGVEMDIKLASVGPKLGGPPEGGEGVLGALAGGPAVGDDFGAGHEQ
jgi:hypothetical protein